MANAPVSLGDKGPVEAVQGIIGERHYASRTIQTEARARSTAALEAWHLELYNRGRPRREWQDPGDPASTPGPCALPALHDLSRLLANTYVGYHGHELGHIERLVQNASLNSAIQVQPRPDEARP